MALAQLTSVRPGAATSRGVTLVVYAPFGTDLALTGYPGDAATTVEQHPLLRNLARVAACGVHVCALVDLVGEGTWLVEFTANRRTPRFTTRWKQRMDAIEPLRGLIRHACERRPGTTLVLGLEGHGAGYLPEIDLNVLTAEQVTNNGEYVWHLGQESSAPMLPMGSPVLPMGSPVLPMGSPVLPTSHVPLSTWALGQALRLGLKDQRDRLGVLLFNGCFNMSVEVLHTVAPLAEFAGGFANYNFFTAGEAYAAAFEALAAAGGHASTQALATALVQANGRILKAKSHHPTIGSVVKLSRMPLIARRLDTLSRALIGALTMGDKSHHLDVALKIREVIRGAQQYDTHTPVRLEALDELTDLGSLAHGLIGFPVNAGEVRPAAAALAGALKGIKVYGDSGSPWLAPGVNWDFSRDDLSMNVFLPDPGLNGLWDWRAPYYLQPDADTRQPAVQPHVIDFLKKTAWVDFIIEYHRHQPFKGLRAARIPACARFNPAHGLA
jgi:hypothetical protein